MRTYEKRPTWNTKEPSYVYTCTQKRPAEALTKRDLVYGKRDLVYGKKDLVYGKRDLVDLMYGKRDLLHGK